MFNIKQINIKMMDFIFFMIIMNMIIKMIIDFIFFMIIKNMKIFLTKLIL